MGVAPFVRIPSIDAHQIARILDCGALGIIAPHIQSASQAEAVVRAAKYPPSGERPFSGALPHLQFRTFPTKETYAILNDATMVVVMIESTEALAAVDEIAAVPGVDILFIGTNDLCNSLGVPGELDHELVRDAYGRTMEACRRHKKHLGVGGLASRPDLVKNFIALGARYLSTGSDLAFLQGAAAQKVQQFA
jgi:2-keto-3-deoxy-L-rhamnonate aldolase RhmA